MSKMRRGDLYDKRYYERRGYNRRKRKIIAYTLRGAVCVAAVLILTLIICGILYVAEHLFSRKAEANASDLQTEGSVEGELQGEDISGQEMNGQDPVVPEEPPKYLVVLDAGHGGKDEGTSKDKAKEKDINLAVVLKMDELLREKGVETFLTRDDDSFVKLLDRAVIANDQGASLFVSIHCNSFAEDKRVKGLECYYHPESDSGKELAETLCEKLKEGGEIETRSAKAEDYSVLRNTECQAILVEIGYLTNDEERALLLDEEYQEKLAKELVEALCSINTEMIPEEGPAD